MARTAKANPNTTCPKHLVDVTAKGYAVDSENRWFRCPGVKDDEATAGGHARGTCLFTRTR